MEVKCTTCHYATPRVARNGIKIYEYDIKKRPIRAQWDANCKYYIESAKAYFERQKKGNNK